MILRFGLGATEQTVQRVRARLAAEGVAAARSREPRRPILAALGTVPASLAAALAREAGVEACVTPKGAWRQVDRAYRDTPTVVTVGGVAIGDGAVAVIAGPCSVEGPELVLEAARIAANAGAHILRGGAYKPRTSPYAFQGLGREGLRLLRRAGDAVGMPVVSEVMDAGQVDAFRAEGIDCLQIGARNMQNFTLLKAAATAGRPVLLKRGPSATVVEWLQAAEYLVAHGCGDVVLCERGIRTFETATRNTLDLTVLPLLREWTHLPVVVDPSHAAGLPALIPPLARAAVAAGCDGIAVEAHPRPTEALSDGEQALLPGELAQLVASVRVIAAVVGGRFGERPPPTRTASTQRERVQ